MNQYQKSFGVPNHVKGVKVAAEITSQVLRRYIYFVSRYNLLRVLEVLQKNLTKTEIAGMTSCREFPQ